VNAKDKIKGDGENFMTFARVGYFNHAGYITYGKYTVEEVLDLFRKNDKVVFNYVSKQGATDNVKISNWSQRMRTLLYRGRKCRECGVKANVFYLEQKVNCKIKPYLNLYRECRDGSCLLFSMDHIIPKCLGGPTEPENLQLMCCGCNNHKGSRIETKFLTPKLVQMAEIFNPRLFEGLSSTYIASLSKGAKWK
jgi:5-methylcytosine-specific restriction endonuclease McrA